MGKSQLEYKTGATEEPWSRTCPMYCFRLPAVQAVLSDRRDYERGALGNVLDLECGHLDILRVAEDEHANWETAQHQQLSAK